MSTSLSAECSTLQTSEVAVLVMDMAFPESQLPKAASEKFMSKTQEIVEKYVKDVFLKLDAGRWTGDRSKFQKLLVEASRLCPLEPYFQEAPGRLAQILARESGESKMKSLLIAVELLEKEIESLAWNTSRG